MSALTGQYLYNQASEIGGWFNSELVQSGNQADTYFTKAFLEVIEDLYLGIQDQRIKDELYGLVTSDFNIAIINPNSNAVNLAPQTALNITYVPSGLDFLITVTTVLPHNLFTGEYIFMENAVFTTRPPNGRHQVTVTTSNEFTYLVVQSPTGNYTANTGTFYAYDGINDVTLQPIDYYHLLNVTTTYLKTIYPPINVPTLIIGATNTSPVRVSLFTYNKLRSGDQLTLAGFSLNTNANGTFYINKVNDLQFDLYADKYFQTPIAGNGAFVASDPMTVAITYIRAAKPYMPDEKISPLSNPSEENPRYLESDSVLNFYPQPPSLLKSITMDYVRLPVNIYGTANNSAFPTDFNPPYKYIDTTDNILDLSTFYHPRFLMRLPEAVVALVARMSKDDTTIQESQVITQANP